MSRFFNNLSVVYGLVYLSVYGRKSMTNIYMEQYPLVWDFGGIIMVINPTDQLTHRNMNGGHAEYSL